MVKMSSNAKTHDHKYKDLITRFPIASIIELGKHRKVVKFLASTSNALRFKIDHFADEIRDQVKAQVEKLQASDKDAEEIAASEIDVEVNWDIAAGTPVKLGAFIGVAEGEPELAYASMQSVAWLFVQDDMQISSEEFALLELAFSEENDFLPIVTGYSPELFKKHA